MRLDFAGEFLLVVLNGVCTEYSILSETIFLSAKRIFLSRHCVLETLNKEKIRVECPETVSQFSVLPFETSDKTLWRHTISSICVSTLNYHRSTLFD